MNDSKPLIRLSTPADIASSVPHLVGYTPPLGSTVLIQLVNGTRVGLVAVLTEADQTKPVDLTRHFDGHPVLAVHYGPAAPGLTEKLSGFTGGEVHLFQVVGPMVCDSHGEWTEIGDAPDLIRDRETAPSREERAKICAGDPAAESPSTDPLIRLLGSNKLARDRWLVEQKGNADDALSLLLGRLRACHPDDSTADQAREAAGALAALTGDGALLYMIEDTLTAPDPGGLIDLSAQAAQGGMNVPRVLLGVLEELAAMHHLIDTVDSLSTDEGNGRSDG